MPCFTVADVCFSSRSNVKPTSSGGVLCFITESTISPISLTWSLCPSTDLYDECLCCDQSSMKLSSLLVGAPCGEVGLIVDLVSFEEQIVSSPSKQQLANSLQVDTLPIATRQLSQTLLQGVIVSHTYHVSEYSELYVLLCSNLLQFFFYPFAHCLQLQQQIWQKEATMMLSGLLSFVVFLLSFCLLSSGHDGLGSTAPMPISYPVKWVFLALLSFASFWVPHFAPLALLLGTT